MTGAPGISAEPLLIELSWPAKELSPNARIHRMAQHRFKKAARTEAGWATKMVRPFGWSADGPLSVKVTAYPPKNWNTGDKDNLISRMKAHFDGIADALDCDDKIFESPIVTWADKTERGMVVIRIGGGV